MFGIKKKIISVLKQSLTVKSFFNIGHTQDLMTHFKADEYGHEANFHQGDLGYGWIHYGLIRQQKPKRLLCVGSRYGFIPAIMAQACKDNGFGSVDFVDAGYGFDSQNHWTGEGYWQTKQGKECFNDFELGKYISLFVTTTKTFAAKYSNNYYDYIYIDGDHSYKGILLDFKLFYPMLLKGGYMLFHDICVKETLPEGEYGVWRLWKKIGQKNGITINNLGSGLGIIQKNDNYNQK